MTPSRSPNGESDEFSVSFERRTGNRVAVVGLLLAALVNIVTVVWFAASLNAAVSNLAESNRNRDITQAALAAQVAQITQQLAVIADRVMRSDGVKSQ